MKNIASLVFIITACLPSQSQESENSKVVQELAAEVSANYIFEDKAKEMSNLLLANLEGGKYSGLASKELANKLHSDLRSVVDDRHLRVRYGPRTRSGARREIPYYPNSVGEAKILNDNVGYFEITGFQQPGTQLRRVVAETMEKLKNTKAIIVDLRNNGGGSPAGVQLICSYFFPAEPSVLLNSLYFRNRDRKNDFYTLANVKGPRLPDVPLYLLTSAYTFSGAEEFAYNLKHLKRVTIVGEVTGGGAHPVDGFSLPQDITAIIPIGRAINPVTGTNWEAVGVTPHVKVDEDLALQKALKLIKEL